MGIELQLYLKTSAGKLRYHGLAAGLQRAAAAKGKELWIPLAANSQGWHYVQLDDTKQADITVHLRERCYAREAQAYDAAPLIPWSFYFWSASRYSKRPCAFLPPNDGSTVSIDGHQSNVQVHGYSPFFKFDSAFPGAGTFAWESDPNNGHVLPPNDDRQDQYWQGHCDAAAAASIFFHSPAPATHNGRTFDVEELKLFATEWAGNWSRGAGRIWEIGQQEPGWALHPSELRPNDVWIGTAYNAAKPSERTVAVNDRVPVAGLALNGWYWDTNGKKFPSNTARAAAYKARQQRSCEKLL
jgi:hypothetical protein